jgi:glycosyltransferase involved in cell wall biosynthesis
MKALVNSGHEVHLACTTRKNEPSAEMGDGIVIHRKYLSTFYFKMSVAALRLPFYFWFWRKFVRQLSAAYSYDAVHVHDLPLAKIGLELKQQLGVKFVLDLHENWPASLEGAVHTNTIAGRLLSSNKQWRKYERAMVKQADGIVAVVEEMKNRIVQLGADESKVFIVSNFLNLIPDFPDIRLWIIGKGSYLPELISLTKQLGLEDHVEFKGWMNFEGIASNLMQSDVALIPHLKSEQTDNSSPNKLYQYMYANKPIMTSNCDSLARVVSAENVGVVYKHDNPEDFARKFRLLMQHRNKFVDGQIVVNSRYLWQYAAERLCKLYEELS